MHQETPCCKLLLLGMTEVLDTDINCTGFLQLVFVMGSVFAGSVEVVLLSIFCLKFVLQCWRVASKSCRSPGKRETKPSVH